MDPSQVLSNAFFLFVVLPVPAAVLAFKGPPAFRQIARIILFCAWLALTAATLACLWYAFGKPSSGIGNGVLVLVAIPIAVFAFIWFGLWRAARRHEYVQSLPPAERRVEELADIESGLEGAKKNLESCESRLDRWGISSEDRRRLQFEIGVLKMTIAKLEEERAKRAS
jgi:hypothetical protein